jgi:hypothetical protein
MGECEARTQGAAIAALLTRLRTQHRAAQRGQATQQSFRFKLLAVFAYPSGSVRPIRNTNVPATRRQFSVE